MKKELKRKLLNNVAEVTKHTAVEAGWFPSLFCFYEPRIPEKLKKMIEKK